MRYRRLSYRYAIVMATTSSRPFGEGWPRQATSVGLARPWRPATDVVETANEVVVIVELPGVDHEQLDVLLFEDALIVDGERRLPAHEAGVFHVAEIQQGQFHLEIPLPSMIDPDRVDARYERGLLEMRFVKRAASRSTPTSIPISRVVDGAATEVTPPDVTAGSIADIEPTPARPGRPTESAPRRQRDA